jgi:predicted DNA-binding protein
MHKTMVYLPVELHKNLKRLAVERDTSVAELIRDAAVALVSEDEEDLAASRKALAEFRRNPASAVPLEAYHRRRSSR